MQVLKNSIFIYLVVLKIILAFLFSSQFSRDLFLPFLNSVSYENWNPWQAQYEEGKLDSFPYHGLMFFLLLPFGYLGELVGLGNFFIKIPLLFSDIGILVILLKLFPNNDNKVFLYYFFNPIIIYSTYIHTQLDIIPTVLLFSSIYFLTTQKIHTSSIFFGFALATKIHVIIILPLIIFYLYKKFSILKVIRYFSIFVIIVLFFDFPFIFSEGFYHMVINNQKQSLLFDTFNNYSLNFLYPIAVVILVFFHLVNQSKLNNDLIFFYCTILFTALIFFIYPSPAWYVWMTPFLSIYFIKNQNQNKSQALYALLSCSYTIFFLFFYTSDYKDVYFLGQELDLKFKSEKLTNLSFTFLQVSLLAIMYSFYQYGVKSNSIFKKKTNISIGIGGDSGSGKTRLLLNLKNIFRDKLLAFEGDGEHKWERGNSNWDKFTHLDPKANYIHKQADYILQLKQNQTISRVEYDHELGKFTKSEVVKPREFIAIAGLHPFYNPKLRKNIDFKIYLDTEESLRKHWKSLRDISKRKYTEEQIKKQIKKRIIDSKKYIHPQKKFADMVINFFPIKDFKSSKKNIYTDIGLEINMSASVYIEDFIQFLNSKLVKWDYNEDLNSQYIRLKKPPLNNFEILAKCTIENINDVIDPDAKWAKGYDGLLQYLCIKIICEKLKEE